MRRPGSITQSVTKLRFQPAGVEIMSGVLLIFGLPMIIAAGLISPSALHNLVHGVLLYAILALLLPFAGWRVLLAVFAFPPAGTGRLAAVLNLWIGGTLMVAAVINLAIAVLDYSPTRPGPNPTTGFLLAGLVLCMVLSFRGLGAFAPNLRREGAISGGLTTRALLFVAVPTLRFLVSR